MSAQPVSTALSAYHLGGQLALLDVLEQVLPVPLDGRLQDSTAVISPSAHSQMCCTKSVALKGGCSTTMRSDLVHLGMCECVEVVYLAGAHRQALLHECADVEVVGEASIDAHHPNAAALHNTTRPCTVHCIHAANMDSVSSAPALS